MTQAEIFGTNSSLAISNLILAGRDISFQSVAWDIRRRSIAHDARLLSPWTLWAIQGRMAKPTDRTARLAFHTKIIARSVRNFASGIEVRLNRSLGREFIPKRAADTLAIETSSLCNLKCRFCAYEKKQSPRVTMKDEFFVDCVTQALGMGYRRFNLTPCTGDIFMDRGIFRKMEFLDSNAEVESFEFFTNFTILKSKDIERLTKLTKLKSVVVSIYGHDLETFVAITKSTENVYHRLVRNLETLLQLVGQKKFHLEIAVRSTMSVPRSGSSTLMRILRRFENAGIHVHKSGGLYNNWGGAITQSDVEGLQMRISDGKDIHKNGACTLLLTTVQILASGIVNGCSCRDVDATLRIGDLNKAPLREIISRHNAVYMQLIDEQQEGRFRPICKTCDFYQSIYHRRRSYGRNGLQTHSLAEFKVDLDRPR
jgi:sulfatase maturation enzyme AslB (radical SAM superfamily)